MAEKAKTATTTAKPRKATAKKTAVSSNVTEITATRDQMAAAREQKAISREEVAQLAHRLFTERGGQHGHAEDDWFRAEQLLRGKAS
jgi:hypothetical protein